MKPRRLRFTREASGDLLRLFQFLADADPRLATRALASIRTALGACTSLGFIGRKVGADPYLREIVIPFGKAGYVALYRVSDDYISVLAVRHQREDDYQ